MAKRKPGGGSDRPRDDVRGAGRPQAADQPQGAYRPCVGVMLLNRDGRVWVGRRNDITREAWQMPQGGIDPGETPRQAAERELCEETGVEGAECLAEHDKWLHYDLPDDLRGQAWKGRYRGQTQRWFAFRFLGADSDIVLDGHVQEFVEWRWVDVERVPDLIVAFKRDVYRQVVDAFRHLAKPADPT